MGRLRAAGFSTRPFNHVAYRRAVKEAKDEPEAFWSREAAQIDWQRAPNRSLPQDGVWFGGGRLNTAYQAIDRHVNAKRGGNDAIIFESSVTGEKRHLTYSDLQEETSKLAHVLQRLEVDSGDPVLIYAPSLPESILMMLASARIGAPHCVVFAGFAPKQLAARIEHVKPKLIFCIDYALEGSRRINLPSLIQEALSMTKHQARVLVHYRDGGDGDGGPFESYTREMKRSESLSLLEAVPVPSDYPLYYIHTSGTTGEPKGLVRQHGGHAVSLSYAGRSVYGLSGPGKVFWAASDIGWIVGHSWSVYGPLICGATSLIVEGKPVNCPDHLEWFRLLERHAVNSVFCAPTALRAIRKESSGAAEFEQFNLMNLQTCNSSLTALYSFSSYKSLLLID